MEQAESREGLDCARGQGSVVLHDFDHKGYGTVMSAARGVPDWLSNKQHLLVQCQIWAKTAIVMKAVLRSSETRCGTHAGTVEAFASQALAFVHSSILFAGVCCMHFTFSLAHTQYRV